MNQDRHLNIFRFYSESTNKPEIENNLTRALAICVKYDPIFALAFFSEIMEDVLIHNDESPYIDLQSSPEKLEIAYDQIDQIYAISITPNDSYTQECYDKEEADNTSSTPILDMVFTINGKLVVCEAKKNQENCLSQLKYQVQCIQDIQSKLNNKKEVSVVYKSLSWRGILYMIEGIIKSDTSWAKSYSHFLIEDLYSFLVSINPNLLKSKKLDVIQWDVNGADKLLDKRLEVIAGIVNQEEGEAIHKPRWMQFNTRWAEKFIVWGSESSKGNNNLTINFGCWSGHTMPQTKCLLENKDSLNFLSFHNENESIMGKNAKVSIEPYIRFYQWQREFHRIPIDIDTAQKLFTDNNQKKIVHSWHRNNEQAQKKWDQISETLNSLDIKEYTKDVKDSIEEQLEGRNHPYVSVTIGFAFLLEFQAREIAKLEKTTNKSFAGDEEDDKNKEIVAFFQAVRTRMEEIINNNESYKQ